MRNYLFYSLLLLSSCGYRWQPDFPDHLRPTVYVPFIQGDEDGVLTKEIISALSRSGVADVKSSGGMYNLKVAILGNEVSKIGFRVDPQKVFGKVRKSLLTSEERRTLSLEVSLYQGGDVAFGPFKISADADYDFVDGDSIQDLTFVGESGQVLTVLPFSLGQLEPKESAALAATEPLYRRLAQKVVDAISSKL